MQSVDVENNLEESRKTTLLYYFQGDTLINNQQYQKMYAKRNDSIFQRLLPNGTNQLVLEDETILYTAAMRQNLDVIYYIPIEATTEVLYADYNIQLGDVLNYRWNLDNETVTEIDSFLLGSNYITRYKLSNEHYFYEGIGASYGLFQAWQVNANIGGFLTCFRLNNDELQIENPVYSSYNYCDDL